MKTLFFVDLKKLEYNLVGDSDYTLKNTTMYKNFRDSIINFEGELYKIDLYAFDPSVYVKHISSDTSVMSNVEFSSDNTKIGRKCKLLALKILNDWTSEVKFIYESKINKYNAMSK